MFNSFKFNSIFNWMKNEWTEGNGTHSLLACNPLMPIHSRFNARDELRQLIGVAAPFVHSCWNHQISFQFANWIEIDWLKSLVPCAASSIQLSFTECNEIELAPCSLPLHSFQFAFIGLNALNEYGSPFNALPIRSINYSRLSLPPFSELRLN